MLLYYYSKCNSEVLLKPFPNVSNLIVVWWSVNLPPTKHSQWESIYKVLSKSSRFPFLWVSVDSDEPQYPPLDTMKSGMEYIVVGVVEAAACLV